MGLLANGLAGYVGLRGSHGLRGPAVGLRPGDAEDGVIPPGISPFFKALNNQLRTGADKGNPTV